jgi:hypothetical protein
VPPRPPGEAFSRNTLTLLNASKERAQTIGAHDSEDALAHLASVTASFGAGVVPPDLTLGPYTTDATGNFLPGSLGAAYYNGNITFNSNLDWSTGTTVACQADGTNCKTTRVSPIGIGPNLSPAQQFDLFYLHELSHSFWGQA